MPAVAAFKPCAVPLSRGSPRSSQCLLSLIAAADAIRAFPVPAMAVALAKIPDSGTEIASSYARGRAVETLFSILQVIISVIVVLLVLMHSGKDSGLSGAFGVGSGTGPLGGGSMVERNLNRWTIFFAILFVINAVILLKRPWA